MDEIVKYNFADIDTDFQINVFNKVQFMFLFVLENCNY